MAPGTMKRAKHGGAEADYPVADVTPGPDMPAMNRTMNAGDDMVPPSTVIRGIIGSNRLPGFVERRDGPGLAFAAAHAALIGAAGWMLWRVLGTAWAVPEHAGEHSHRVHDGAVAAARLEHGLPHRPPRAAPGAVLPAPGA